MSASSTPIVDWTALLKVVYISLAASLSIVTAFTLAVIGTTRSTEARRSGQVANAAGYALLGLLGTCVTAASVIVGLVYMTQK